MIAAIAVCSGCRYIEDVQLPAEVIDNPKTRITHGIHAHTKGRSGPSRGSSTS